ncbi:MAG TPA: ATP-binding cassette domain-containing protein [Candidatus Methylacidiphilales bacterium]|nr:ATP-binding cassette domain-containing protein [Candidatus Methylacidiphilales bacterium]
MNAEISSAPLVRLVGVEKKLRRQRVLRGVNLEICTGENMVIIGRSGGGKSVLLKHILGLMQPDAGEIWFRNHNLAQLTEEQMVPLRKETGMLFQNGALFDSLTVGENVAFPLRERGGVKEEEIGEEVTRALKIVDLPGQESKWPSELSGGMRKRVALARAAISRPALMLYDEPTSGLDPIVADSINKLMVRLGRELNMTSVIVTHDMVSAREVGDRIAMLHEGRIYCVDEPKAVLESQDPIVKRFVNGISDASDAIF